MRLTGGRWGGRSLRSARGEVRPTSDRVRESIFARLGDLEDATVLDLYAGTGALGLEALSRGARALVCVERAPRSLAALRANIENLNAFKLVEVIPGAARSALYRLGRSGARFDLVLLDPPYASDEVERALAGIQEQCLLQPGAMVVIERSRRHALPDLAGLEVLDERRYGDTLVTRLVAPELETATNEVSTNQDDPRRSNNVMDDTSTHTERADASRSSEVRVHPRAALRATEDETGNE
jgi:16S rRNA (guanine966-N2)-methyltransferase